VIRHDAYARLAGMSAAFATSNVARTAIGFATALVIGRGLGLEGFGRWTLCMAWAALLTMVFDLGFGVLLTRDAARDDPGVGRIVGAALCARFGVLLPACALFFAAAPWLTADPRTVTSLRIAPAIAAAGLAYSCFAPVFRTKPRSLVAILAIEAVSALAQTAGAWWLIRHGDGVASLLVLAAGAQVAQCGAALVLWRMTHGVRYRIECPRPIEALGILRRALPFALAGVIANLQVRIAPLLVGYLSGAAALASFGAATKIGNLVRMLPQAAFAGALPVLASEVQRGDADAVRSRFDDLLLWFAGTAAVGLAIFAGPVIRVAYGVEFAPAATTLIWVAAGLVPALINSGRKVYLYASGLEQVAVRWSAVALVSQVVACGALIPTFGAAGAAAALAVGEAVVWWPLQRRVQPLELARRPVGVMGESPLAG
jgi:O-antigen/teichoic acid export membrane protein